MMYMSGSARRGMYSLIPRIFFHVERGLGMRLTRHAREQVDSGHIPGIIGCIKKNNSARKQMQSIKELEEKKKITIISMIII